MYALQKIFCITYIKIFYLERKNLDGKWYYCYSNGSRKRNKNESKNSKLVQKIYGKEIVKRAVENAEKAGVKDIVAVVGYKKEEVMKVLGDNIKYAFQDEMLGTGHAVMQAKEYLKGKKGKVLVLNVVFH